MPHTPEADGVSIGWSEVGADGDVLLLISGTGHDRNFWSRQVPTFARHFRVITLDNRGVGSSTSPASGYTLGDMADDAVRVMDHAGIERCHVMGFSMGGHIAQEIAIHHGERVRTLGVHHSWARNSPRLRSFQETRRDLARNDQRLALAEFSILGLHSHDWYNEHAEELDEHRRFLLDQSPVNAGWVGQLEACLSGDTSDRLDSVVCPTLVTSSDLDLIAAPHHGREIASLIPGATFHLFEGTGHVALIERPEAFSEVCLDFLEKNARA
ncbi:MAG: alpha/beta fold hydrolase [Acidimicrobiales bacterium]